MIAVTFALPNESSDFVRRMRREDCNYAAEVRVVHTGVGQSAARKSLANFLEKNSPRLLISSGFAGALTDELKPGDIFAAENFSAPKLLALLDVKFGRLETIDAILDSLGERQAFARRTGAMAVDMETRFIAEACARAGVPMLSLRAISDSPAAPFGIPTRVLFDVEQQRTSYRRLIAYVLRHPSAIGKLFSLGKQIGRARRSLTNALEVAIRASSRSGVF